MATQIFDKHRAIQYDVDQFSKMLEWACDITKVDVEERLNIVTKNADLFQIMLETRTAPSSHWELIASGSYKESYFPQLTTNFVIKFATTRNPSIDESIVLRRAEADSQVSPFFCPTQMHKLESMLLPSEHIYTCNTTPPLFNYVIVQPWVTIQDELGYVPLLDFGRAAPRNIKLFNEDDLQQVPREDLDRMSDLCNSLDWWQQGINEWGWSSVQALLHFCDTLHIADLHEANVGYYIRDNRELPVILDWISEKCAPPENTYPPHKN